MAVLSGAIIKIIFEQRMKSLGYNEDKLNQMNIKVSVGGHKRILAIMLFPYWKLTPGINQMNKNLLILSIHGLMVLL